MKNDELAKRLGKRLRAARGETTLREFARRLGISKSSLNAMEQGAQNVTLATLETICRRLGCNPGDLLDPDEK